MTKATPKPTGPPPNPPGPPPPRRALKNSIRRCMSSGLNCGPWLLVLGWLTELDVGRLVVLVVVPATLMVALGPSREPSCFCIKSGLTRFSDTTRVS